MDVTTTTAAYNRRTAATVIRTRLGLMDKAPSDWTYEERVAYNKALSGYIAENPQAFTDGEIQVAKDINQKVLDPLDDTSLMSNLGLFGNQFLVEAEKVLDTSGSVLRKSIYIAVAVAVLAYASPFIIKAWKESQTK